MRKGVIDRKRLSFCSEENCRGVQINEESIDQWREDEENGVLSARFTSYNGVEVLKSIDAKSWGRGEHSRLHRTKISWYEG